MVINALLDCSQRVALLAEGVDRNQFFIGFFPTRQPSPSSRRAWIEIRSRVHR